MTCYGNIKMYFVKKFRVSYLTIRERSTQWPLLSGHCHVTKSRQLTISLKLVYTFYVKKATGGWRIVHAYNKLNAATIPAQTPIPRKDVIIDGMGGSTMFSTMDLRDEFYQILMLERDIPLTSVSTLSDTFWKWLVKPQRLMNAPSYFDDVFTHSRAERDRTDIESISKEFCALCESITCMPN